MNESEWLMEMVAKFPVPAAKDGKLAEVDKTATDAAIAELARAGASAIVGLVGMLVPPEKGGDGRVRHVLHTLVIHAGGQGDTRRQLVAEALASTLASDQPAESKTFVLQQLQLIGGREVVPKIGKSRGRALADPAAALSRSNRRRRAPDAARRCQGSASRHCGTRTRLASR